VSRRWGLLDIQFFRTISLPPSCPNPPTISAHAACSPFFESCELFHLFRGNFLFFFGTPSFVVSSPPFYARLFLESSILASCLLFVGLGDLQWPFQSWSFPFLISYSLLLFFFYVPWLFLRQVCFFPVSIYECVSRSLLI